MASDFENLWRTHEAVPGPIKSACGVCQDCGKAWPCEGRTMYVELERLQDWVNDLQAGMFINCVYCGHRYGPDSEVPATMADVLKEHIAQCPKHPMLALTEENRALREKLETAEERHTDHAKPCPKCGSFWGKDEAGEVADAV